jgi:two-component system cell cycle sensor histidine kinase/response regulator CckA
MGFIEPPASAGQAWNDDALRLLADAGEAVGPSHDVDETLRRIAHFLVPRVGDLCVITVLEANGAMHPAEVVAADPAQGELMSQVLADVPLHISQTQRLPARVAATGEPLLMSDMPPDFTQRHTLDARHRRRLDAYRPLALIIAPLAMDGRVLGTLAVSSNARRYGGAELALVQEFARRASAALHHAAAYRAAEESLEYLRRLQRITGRLVAASDADAVFDVIVPEVLEGCGAMAGAVALAAANGSVFRTHRSAGYPAEVVGGFIEFPLAATLAAGPGTPGWVPVHAAWQSGRAVWIESKAAWEAAYQHRPAVLGPGGDASWAVLPLRGRHVITGVLTFTFPAPGRFDPQRVAFLEAAAEQCAAALDRSAAEERARAGAAALARVSDMVVTFDAAWRFTFINDTAAAAYREMGLDPVGMLGQVLWTALPGVTGTVFETEFRRAMADQQPVAFEAEFGPEGRWLAARAYPSRDGLTLVALDVHAQRQTEERLRQSSKMEAIGRMAGGIAHDFRNQLQAIDSFADFIERDRRLGPVARKDLFEIRRAADRMTSLTTQLLAFSRQQVLSPEVLELNGTVADTQAMLQRLIGTQIQIRTSLSAEPLWVRIDPAQLQQVVLNLAINARDAMPDGGEIVIETERLAVAAGQLDVAAGSAVAPGTYALLRVRDSGAGIAPEHLRLVFDPFFTTKSVGQGTGLGLATVQGIVAQSGGHVWATSAAGAGATITALLPIADEAAAYSADDAGDAGGQRPSGSMLVVDDEDAVRRVMTRIVEDGGYRAVQARDGREALAVLDGGTPVDLVLSDVVMPVMGGAELGRHLAARFATIPVVWMSAHPQDVLRREELMAEDQIFLQKPIAPDLLLKTIAAALRAAGRAEGAR